MERDCVSPQQPDGIFNIHSWNVRNAGLSDLTEGEKAERTDKPGETHKTKRRDEGKCGTATELWAPQRGSV